MNKDNKNELIVIKKQSIFSKIANFIKNIFGKKENLVDEVISQENIEKIELEKVSDLEEKVNKAPKTLDEKIAAVDLVPDISDEERLKRKLRIYEAHDRKVREQRMEQIEVKRLTDVDYYKDIYNKVNEGIIGVEDLTSDEFSKILKMQKLEYEVITKKLKDAMDKFLEFSKNSILVAHNAEFDMGFISSVMDRYNLGKFDFTVIDTLLKIYLILSSIVLLVTN